MKTMTILSAYLRARDIRFGVRSIHHPNSRARQLEVFRAALLRRIERGDQAIMILKEIAGYEIYGDTTGDQLINQAREFLGIGKQDVS